MNKLLFFPFVIILFHTSVTTAQNPSFGVSAGLLNGNGRITENNGSASSSDTGFYLGVFSKIQLTQKISLFPELDYGNLNDNSFAFASVRAGYYLAPKFFVQAGPEITYLFDVLTDDVNSAGVNLSMGLGYEINDNFHIQARYAPELTNRIKNATTDIRGTFNWLHIGIGYTFF